MSESKRVDHRSADLRRGTETLAETNTRLRRQIEVAEQLIPQLNEMLERVQTTQIVQNTVLVGRTIQQLPYLPVLGPQDSGQVYQVALVLPGGLGAVAVDAGEYLDQQSSLVPATRDVPLRFLRFEECPNVVKALILPEAHKLLGRLFANLEIMGNHDS
jgi:hypothetical protein